MPVTGSAMTQIQCSYYLGSKASPHDLPWGLPVRAHCIGMLPIESCTTEPPMHTECGLLKSIQVRVEDTYYGIFIFISQAVIGVQGCR